MYFELDYQNEAMYYRVQHHNVSQYSNLISHARRPAKHTRAVLTANLDRAIH